MAIESRVLVCADCEKEFDLSSNVPDQELQLCTNCGSHKKLWKVLLEGSATFYGSRKVKKRNLTSKKPLVELITGSEIYKKINKIVRKERIIDRENDRYKETITDPDSNEIIHSVDESLSEHTGHGSAKFKKSD